MWELDHKESWVLKNWCFWTVLSEKTLENPWTAKRSNQANLKKISPRYSLEELMLSWSSITLAKYLLMRRTDSLENTLILGKFEGGRKRGWQRIDGFMASLTWWAWVWASPGAGDGQGSLVCCSPGVANSWTQLNNWTELTNENNSNLFPTYTFLKEKTLKFWHYI